MRITSILLALITIAAAAWAAGAQAAMAGERQMAFSLKSSDIQQGERIEKRFTCDGEDISPELHWEDVPAGAESLALIVEDPDAPMGTFIHWVLYDIPADLDGLARGASRSDALKRAGMKEGTTGFGRRGYNGPCPPPGHGDHRYYFRLLALDVKRLDVRGNANKADVEEAMRGHILAEASLMGIYSR